MGVEQQVGEFLEAAQDQPALPGPQARRDPLDREQQAIKDDVLRMGAGGEANPWGPPRRWSRHDAALALSIRPCAASTTPSAPSHASSR